MGTIHACARLANGTVRCWGNDEPASQLGAPRQFGESGAVLAEIEDVTQIAAGETHTCALVQPPEPAPSQVWCWGSSRDAAPREEGVSTVTPTPVPGTEGAISVDVNYEISCAVMADATAVCWGFNLSHGPLATSSEPQAMGLADVAQVSPGGDLRCARYTDGDVECWSAIRFRQDGPIFRAPLDAVHVSVTHEHGCAATAAGGVWCWGEGAAGQLGHGQFASSAEPVEVQGIEGRVVQVAAGEAHSCARTDTGRVWCWGAQTNGSFRGLLGNRSGMPSATPVQARIIADAVDLSAGATATCVARAHGEVLCWGDRIWEEGQPFNALDNHPQAAPVPGDL